MFLLLTRLFKPAFIAHGFVPTQLCYFALYCFFIGLFTATLSLIPVFTLSTCAADLYVLGGGGAGAYVGAANPNEGGGNGGRGGLSGQGAGGAGGVAGNTGASAGFTFGAAGGARGLGSGIGANNGTNGLRGRDHSVNHNRGGDGGDGGNATSKVSGAYDSVFVIGGAGGNAGGHLAGAYGGDGGDGGNASLNAVNFKAAVGLTVTSGTNGVKDRNSASSGGLGGMATFTANTLAAPVINLIQEDDLLTFNVATLDVSTASTTLNLNGTTAAGVNIINVNIDNGHTFTATFANNGAAVLDTLNINGDGGALAIPAALTFNNVNLANGSSFTATNKLTFNNMKVTGKNITYIGDLNAAGRTLNFELPMDAAKSIAITVSGTATIDAATNFMVDDSAIVGGLRLNDLVVLVEAASISGSVTNLAITAATGENFYLNVVDNQLLATLQQLPLPATNYEILKALAEGRAATLAFVNQGQNLVINHGLSSAMAATRGVGRRFAGFASINGGSSRYNTGSHVDVDGFSMLTGIAMGNNLGMGRLTLAVFWEGGFGNYNSHNSFSNYATVKGSGGSEYYGGGVLGRYNLPAGLYAEASARIGRADMDFDTDDILYNGNKAKYNSNSMYYGAHIGVGYIYNVTPQAGFDFSAKLLWTHQEGDSITMHDNNVRFKDADSLRTSLGGRFTNTVNEYFAPYAGVCWEHEFDSKVNSRVNGVAIDAPDTKGDTGMGELGLSLTPFENKGLSLDFSVQGYAGKREGVAGRFNAGFSF